MEIKRILKQYIFSLILILCAASFFFGVITVREKTEYNMKMTPYDTVEVKNDGQCFLFTVGEEVGFVIPDYVNSLVQNLKKTVSQSKKYVF